MTHHPRPFESSLAIDDLAGLVSAQVGSAFPDCDEAPRVWEPVVKDALARLEHCLTRIDQKYIVDSGAARFDHTHTDHYAMFLYYASSSAHRLDAPPAMAARLYALNKALHGLDVFYEVELPDVFLFQHPVGTVLGRASYADYLLVYQRVSVGSSVDGESPKLAEGVVMFGGSTVLGGADIGENTWLSAGATVMGETVPAHSVVFGRSPDLVIRPTERDVKRDIFGVGA